MNRMFRWIFLIACGWGIAPGAEIFATHFASGPFESGELEKSPVLKSAPTATSFIAEGDELRDVTAILNQRKAGLEDGSAVWNQTRRLLVVQGTEYHQSRVEGLTRFWSQPLQARLVVDLTRSAKADGTWVDRASPLASVALIARSGMKENASVPHSDASDDQPLAMEAESWFDYSGWIGCRTSIDWKGLGGNVGERGGIEANINLRDGEPQTLASWFASGHGPTSRLTVKIDILLADGTLWREARLRQEGMRSVAMNLPSAAGPQTRALTDFPSRTKRKVKTMKLQRGDAVTFFYDSSKEDTDPAPFDESRWYQPPPSWNLPEVSIPPDLSRDLSPPMFDLHPFLKRCGISIRDGDFAVYDSIGGRIFVATDDGKVLSQIESLFSLACDLQSLPIEVTAWLSDATTPDSPAVKASLRTYTTSKSTMFWDDSNGLPLVSLEVEPTLGEGSLELRCDWIAPLPGKSPDSSWHSVSSLRLESGIPFLTEAAKLPDGTVFQQGFRATVLAR